MNLCSTIQTLPPGDNDPLYLARAPNLTCGSSGELLHRLNRMLSTPDDIGMAEAALAKPEGSMLQRRRHPRVSVNGKVRLVADTPDGLVTLTGTVIDLSVSGCAIRVHASLDAQREARLELELDGERVWVPGQIVWTRTRDRAWIVGVEFERLVPAKQRLLVRLVAERRRLMA